MKNKFTYKDYVELRANSGEENFGNEHWYFDKNGNLAKISHKEFLKLEKKNPEWKYKLYKEELNRVIKNEK